MKIKYEMTDWAPGRGQYDPPDERILRETVGPEVDQALYAFNDFLRAVWGENYQVDFVEADDDVVS